MTKVVVTGAGGMLGRALMESVPPGAKAVGVTRADGDLADPAGVKQAVSEHGPAAVIHAAACTDVDGCEREPCRAWRDNALATRLVAEACALLDARLVFLSTDYVFDGLAREPYTEEAPANPTSVYGESKLAGERAVAALEDGLVVRTQWLFGPGGRNFIAAVLRRALQGQDVDVVADQTGCPTYTRHLAPALWEAALGDRRGVVHLTGRGFATWADVARAALEAAGCPRGVRPISCDDWPSPTRRPRFSVLAQGKWAEGGGQPLPSWREGVGEYVREFLLEGGQ